MIEITDQEATEWPLDDDAPGCSECGIGTNRRCGFCGEWLCEGIPCIKSHAAKGCGKMGHAQQPPIPVHPPQPLDAGSADDPAHAEQYTTLAVPHS